MVFDNKKIIVSIDSKDLTDATEIIAQLDAAICRLKFGNILFTRYGPQIVEKFMRQGFEIFLDLKYHDIPQTVAGACQSAAALGVWMVNIHVTGGKSMMQAAREAIDQHTQSPLLIGVTLLTSLDQKDLQALGVQQSPKELVLSLARQAQENGLDGVVCSAQEAAMVRHACGDHCVIVTPGIRLPQGESSDQKRIMTPENAIAAGSDYLVIGRTITQSPQPADTLQKIHDAIQRTL